MNENGDSPTATERVGVSGVIAMLAFLLGLVLLLSRPDADPPLISWSIDAFGDPGHYLHNARSLAKWGVFDLAAGHAPYVAPGFFLLNRLGFSLFGATLTTARLVDAAAWALCGGAIFYASRRRIDKAVAGLVFLSLPLLAAACSPKGDLWSVAMLSWGLALLRGETGRAYAGAAFFLACAPFFKLHAGPPAAGAIVAVLAITAWRDRRRLFWFALGLAAAAAIWILYALFLHDVGALSVGFSVARQIVGSVGITGEMETAGSRWEILRFLAGNFWVREPFLGLLGLVGLSAIAISPGAIHKPEKCALLGGVVFSVLILLATPYDPLRYRLAWIPFLALAAQDLPASRAAVAAGGALFGYAIGGWLGLRFYPGHWWPTVLAAFIGGALGWVGASGITPRRLAFFVLAGCILQAGQSAWFFSTRGHELRDAARVMRETLPHDAVLTGFWAPNLALYSDHRVSLAPLDPLTGPATHLVEEDGFLSDTRSLMLLGEAQLPTIRRRVGFYRIEDESESRSVPIQSAY